MPLRSSMAVNFLVTVFATTAWFLTLEKLVTTPKVVIFLCLALRFLGLGKRALATSDKVLLAGFANFSNFWTFSQARLIGLSSGLLLCVRHLATQV